MTPIDFLSVVLPSSGYYCVAELSSPKKEHVFTSTIEEAYSAVQRFDAQDYDVYFGTSTFKKPGSREAVNAKECRSLFVDLDCGPDKAYADAEIAIKALRAFIAWAKLPNPYIVSSGYGVHAYWPFKNVVTPQESATIGRLFKSVCASHIEPDSSSPTARAAEYETDVHDIRIDTPRGEARAYTNGAAAEPKGAPDEASTKRLCIDWNVTGDTARVLRVPGTANWKHRKDPQLGDEAKTVYVIEEGEVVAYEALFATLTYLLPAGAVPETRPSVADALFNGIVGSDTAPRSAVQSLVAANSTSKFSDLVKLSAAGSGCNQLTYYLEKAKSDGMEPLWRGLLSLAKYCTDSEKSAAKLSSLHPYSDERTQVKLSEIKGPYPCHKFNSDNPGVCGFCPHFGKITNPLALVRETQVTTEAKPITVHRDTHAEKKASVPTLIRPAPPKGFAYGVSGGVYEVRKGAEQSDPPTHVLIIPYDFFIVDILSTEGKHVVHFATHRNGTFETITIAQRFIVSKDDTIKALSEQNVMAVSGQDVMLHKYIRQAVEQASFQDKPVVVPASCGWQNDDSFVFDNRVFGTDGTEKTFPMPGLENIFKSSKPTGSLEGWRDVVKMLIRNKEHEILAMSLVGFGAPLMRFTGLYGMTFHIGSTESGTGKTLAIEMAASVWGDPVRSRTTIDTSSIATLNRLGLLGTLPLCTDEITAKNRNDFEWLPAFLFSVTEGHGKERMESGANRERINTTNWQSLVLLSSNTHVMDYLTGARKHSSEGEIRRVLELTLNKQMRMSKDDVVFVKDLKRNYGFAGEKYVRWLVANVDTAKRVVNQTYDALYEDFNATNDERFWMAGAAAIVAGGVLAGSNYAGVMDYPMNAIIGVLKTMVQKARVQAKESLRTAEDILNAFTRQFYGKFIVVRRVAGATLSGSFGSGKEIDESITRSEVAGRVEHTKPGIADYYIEESLIKSFCASMSFGYSDFKQQLSKTCVVKFGQKDMLANTKGPTMVVKTIHIIRRVTNDPEDSIPLEPD